MPDGRRDIERIQILGELPGAASVQQAIFVKELSRGGAQVDTSVPLQLNSIHEFRLSLGSLTVVVKGRVAHCHIEDVDPESVIYRAGIEFVDMPEWVAKALGEFVDALKTGRQA
jgi:PilZ domain-containing protein